LNRRSVTAVFACIVLGAVVLAQSTVHLRLSGEIRAAGACSVVTSGLVRCSIPEGSASVLTLVATATPARTVHIAPLSLPTGWPDVPVASGWGTATARYAFTPPPGSSGQQVELVFRGWTEGVAPTELRVVLDITPPGVPPTNGTRPTLYWDLTRPISWADFWAPPPPDTARQGVAAIAMSLQYSVQYSAARDPATGAWRARASSLVVTNAMERDRSWVVPAHATAAVLNHEQRHFDLNEVYRRILESALAIVVGSGFTPQAAEAQFMAKVEAVFQRVTDLNSEMQARYDRETNHGRDAGQQAEWDKKIAAWLLDPRLAPQP